MVPNELFHYFAGFSEDGQLNLKAILDTTSLTLTFFV